MVREIHLPGGQVALVDDCDFRDVIDVGSWHAFTPRHTTYAHAHYPRLGGKISMHKFITGWGLVDHANGNGLDNRRHNLRPATRGQNSANSRLRSTNTSGFRGVRRASRGTSWLAAITVGGRYIYLGSFEDINDAARAYDTAALEHFGEYARPNFPMGAVA